MPRSFDACVAALSGEGVSPDQARRACSLAFWSEHGVSPSAADARGVDPEGDLAPRARRCAVALSEEARPVVRLELAGEAGELVTFSEADFPAAGTYPRLLREALLIYPGTWNGHEFTAEMLAEMVAEFDPSDPPPIQVDHSDSAWCTQGYAIALRQDPTGRTWVLLEFRGQDAVTRVTEGRWRKLSGGIYVKPKLKLREVSVTPHPAVNGPEGAARILPGGDQKMTVPNPSVAKLADDQKDKPQGTDAEKKSELAEKVKCAKCETMNAASAKHCSECGAKLGKAEAKADPEKPIAKQSAGASEDEAKVLSDYVARVAKLEQRVAEQDKVLKLKEDTELILGLMEGGKLAPAVRDKALAFVGSLTPEQRQAWKELQDASPAYVEFGRRSKPSPAVPPGGVSEEQEVSNLREAANKVRGAKPETVKA